MIKIHCTSCGISEDIDTSEHKIGPVSLLDNIDQRSWTKYPHFNADLCRECLAKLLHNYFGIRAEGSIELPPSIELHSVRMVG